VRGTGATFGLKQMFVGSKANRYMTELNNDVGKLVPKFSALYKKIEEAVAQKEQDVSKLTPIAETIIKLDAGRAQL